MEDFISLFSSKGKSIIIISLIPILLILGNAAWSSVKPATVVQPIAKQIQSLDSSVSALEDRVGRMERNSVVLDFRLDAMSRFMCYQNRKNANLSGIQCNTLAPLQ